MTIKQYLKLSKNHSVINYLNGFIEILKTIPMLYLFFEGLKLNVAAIESISGQQFVNLKGVSRNKGKVKRSLEAQSLIMSKVICAFAVATGNTLLHDKVYCTKSSLEKMLDEELLSFGRIVLKEAETYKQDMVDYALSDQVIKSYETLVNEYADVLTAPQRAQKNGKTLGSSLVTLFKENDIIHKKKMEPLASLLKDKYPEFYEGYLHCLEERDANTINSKAAGTIKDKATGKLLRSVQVRAEGTLFSVSSGKTGKFQLRIPDPGFYTLVFEMEGYQTVILKEVEIKLGQTISFDIEMVAV